MTKERGLYRFTSYYTGDDFIAYLLCEHEEEYEFISPLTYEWMQRRTFSNWELLVETSRIPKKLVALRVCNRFPNYEEWLFTYPLDVHQLKNVRTFSMFFECFHTYRKYPIVSRLEKTILTMERRMPIYLLEELVTFVFNQHFKHPDRLRLVVSPVISNYRKRGGS